VMIDTITKLQSSTSRNRFRPMSADSRVWLVFVCVGSCAPCAVNPCHTIISTTQSAATKMPIRKSDRATRCRDDVDVTLKRYHSRKLTAAGRLRFFSGGLLRDSRQNTIIVAASLCRGVRFFQESTGCQPVGFGGSSKRTLFFS